MATSTGKTLCLKCDKVKCTFKCGGCSQDFCFKHMIDHHQELNHQLDEIAIDHDLFRQSLIEQMQDPNSHSLVEKFNTWEHESTDKNLETAESVRLSLIERINENNKQIEMKLDDLATELKTIQEEDNYNEINLLQLKNNLAQLKTQFTEPSNISICEDSSSFINGISIDIPGTIEQQLDEQSHHSTIQTPEHIVAAIQSPIVEDKIQKNVLDDTDQSQSTLTEDFNFCSRTALERIFQACKEMHEEIGQLKTLVFSEAYTEARNKQATASRTADVHRSSAS